MKKLIALLFFCVPLISNAKAIAWLENQGGGKIVLTDEVCKSKLGLFTYTSSDALPEGVSGCYKVNLTVNQIFIQWNDIEKIYIYEGKNIIFTEEE